MQIREVRTIVGSGIPYQVTSRHFETDGWICYVYRDDGDSWKFATPEIETAKGAIRYFRSLDSLVATMRQLGVVCVEVML